MSRATVLIVEDGDEYLTSLGRFVPGPRYLVAHSAAEALDWLGKGGVDLIYLDMRFDRIDPRLLAGDRDGALRRHGGDAARAQKYLQDNQGLFILDELARGGFGGVPCILAHDFSEEPKRFARLEAAHPRLAWIGDAASADEVRATMDRLLG